MKLTEIFAKLEKVAPVALSDEFCKIYGLYDNSGVILNSGEDICGALFSLDLSETAVAEAKKHGYNLIVTHHPAIYGGISRVDQTCDPQAKAIALCIKNGISVISMHLNYDAAREGIDYHLMRGLGGETAEILAPCTGGGYGRVFEIAPHIYGDYCKKVKKEFNTEKLIAYGKCMRQVRKVASFCGAGCDDKAIAFAAKHGADVFVSADMKHHEICALLGRGINVIHFTHYASENYGFNKIYLKINQGLGIPSAYFNDGDLL